MKCLLILLFVMVGNYSVIFAQSANNIEVLAVREKPQIDSILRLCSERVIPEKSVILIDIRKYKQSYSYYVSCIKTNMALIDLGVYNEINNKETLIYKNNLRYFKYKDILVFVVGDDDERYFGDIDNRKMFTFDNVINADINFYQKRIIHLDSFFVEKGRFVSMLDFLGPIK